MLDEPRREAPDAAEPTSRDPRGRIRRAQRGQGPGREPVDVTLIDRRNFHLFQPLLYQVATGGLSPANIAAPLRAIFKSRHNIEVLLAEVKHVDVAGKCRRACTRSRCRTTCWSWRRVRRIIISAIPSGNRLAPGLKTVEDATEIRRRVLLAFEAAEREPDEARRQHWLTFVVVGGGPTGVELAGAMAELSRHTLRNNFRLIDPAMARIVLVEGVDRVLPSYAARLSARAAESLAAMGVTVRTATMVIDVQIRVPSRCAAARPKRAIATHGTVGGRRRASPLGKSAGRRHRREAGSSRPTDGRARPDVAGPSRDLRDRRPGEFQPSRARPCRG